MHSKQDKFKFHLKVLLLFPLGLQKEIVVIGFLQQLKRRLVQAGEVYPSLVEGSHPDPFVLKFMEHLFVLAAPLKETLNKNNSQIIIDKSNLTDFEYDEEGNRNPAIIDESTKQGIVDGIINNWSSDN